MSENLHDQLNRLVSGYWYTQTIYVATKLGIAELLKDGPRPVQELAGATKTNSRALHRLLRALASIGIFAEVEGRFTLTPLAECLLDPSTKAMATMRGEFQYRAWARRGQSQGRHSSTSILPALPQHGRQRLRVGQPVRY